MNNEKYVSLNGDKLIELVNKIGSWSEDYIRKTFGRNISDSKLDETLKSLVSYIKFRDINTEAIIDRIAELKEKNIELHKDEVLNKLKQVQETNQKAILEIQNLYLTIFEERYTHLIEENPECFSKRVNISNRNIAEALVRDISQMNQQYFSNLVKENSSKIRKDWNEKTQQYFSETDKWLVEVEKRGIKRADFMNSLNNGQKIDEKKAIKDAEEKKEKEVKSLDSDIII